MPRPAVLLQMLTGYKVSRLIYAAAKLGIADLLKDGPRSIDELSKVTETNAQALYRVLRTLASVGIFAEVKQGQRFTLTPLAELLLTGVPGSMRAAAIYFTEDHHWRAYGDIMHTVKTGKPAFEHVFGMDALKCFAQDAEFGRTFDEAMTGITATEEAAIMANYDFSPFSSIVDVGGGNGSLISAILKANPKMKGILFELPHVIEGAKRFIEGQGLTERCELVVGDIFKSVPDGGDAYLLKHIIHAFDDERNVILLKNIHRAMSPKWRLLVCEMVIPPSNEPHFGKLVDIEMLTISGGYERTEAEYQRLFDKAGFGLTKVFQTNSFINVIEGVRT